MLDITFVGPDGKVRRKIQAEAGENLRVAAIRNKFSLYPHILKILNCRGRGLCASCTVRIISGRISPKNELENAKLKSNALNNHNLRLACQVIVNGNLVVKTLGSI